MSGLIPSNAHIRLLDEALPNTQTDPMQVLLDDTQGPDEPVTDNDGNIIRIEHDDGSVTISLDGSPVAASEAAHPKGWFDNLVEDITETELARISDDLMRGIEDDMQSRQDWVEDRAQGIKLLGLKVEIPGLAGAADGAPVEGMSRVRHPLLLEAVLRFQANARSELLPTDGPVKIRDDNNGALIGNDELADALEKDLNHYLTATATEYYPDTDRMLLLLGFGGTAFKKVYFCPLRNRPVSETVDADDLIVNNSATDLSNARRVTHRVLMRPSVVKRLQILGVYRDVDLSTPHERKMDAVQEEKQAQQGISENVSNPNDRDREIYETYCELDIVGFEHKLKGKVTGLEVPYRVTIDVSSKKILSIVRNYDKTDTLPETRENFVKYTFVPGLGFYDIGLLHILGNTTNAITAAWRELLDAGMYSNFPGFLFADVGARQNSNIFRVPPGGGSPVKTGGMPINQAVMPLPYKEPSQALMALVGDMATTGMRIGGTSEQQVGEGRADAPVGTTLAMIEQASKIMNSVHKRLHAAQALEFQLLVKVFREHPESFWQRNKKPAYQWDEDNFLKALTDCELIPQADPNTASHSQRVMKIMALKQLQAASPQLYDPVAIDKAALAAIGFSNPEQFMASPEKQQTLPPAVQKEIATLNIKKQEADTKAMKAKAEAAKAQMHAAVYQKEASAAPEGPSNTEQMTARARLLDAQTKQAGVQVQHRVAASEAQNRAQDRESREKLELLQLAKEIIRHPEGAPIAQPIVNQVKAPQ